MSVVSIKLENHKIHELVEMEVGPHGLIVKGPNGSGKSSFIDAFFIGLTGKEIPKCPITQGKDSSTIEILINDNELGEVKVTRKWTTKSNRIIVETSDGKVDSPQAFLKQLIGKISFDPFDFVKMPPLEQKRLLMDILGLELEDLEEEKKGFLDKANDYMYESERLTRNLQSFPEFEGELVLKSGDEIELKRKANQTKKENILSHRRKIENKEREVDEQNAIRMKHLEEKQAALDKIEQLGEELRKLSQKTQDCEELADAAKYKAEDFTDEKMGLIEELTKLPEPEETDFSEDLKEISAHNDAVNAENRRLDMVQNIESINEKRQNYLDKSKLVEEKRLQRIQSVKMPVEGLSIGDNGIEYNGLPFTPSQTNTATIIRVGVGLKMSMNPNLRIIRIKDWSLIDSKGQLEILEETQKDDFQLLVEKVEDSENIGFEMIEKVGE